MDLTPPSLTTSPYSPQRKSIDSPPPYAYCMPETSSVTYATLTTLDNHPYNVPPPYGSLIDPLLSDQQSVDGSTHMTSLDSMASSGTWTGHPVTAAASPAASTASSMPHIISSEYDHFANYEQSCLPTSYASVGPYGRPTAHSPAFMHTPPPSTADHSGRESSSFSHRGSFGFHPEQTGSKTDMGENLTYNAVSHFSPPPRPLASRFSTNAQLYIGAEFTSTGQAPSPAPTQLQHPQPHLPSAPLPTQISSQASNPRLVSNSTSQQESKLRHPTHEWTRFKQPRKNRPIRKHTTKEDAHFQCQVKGCGKYFSRSYNFKSHMETHDDRREYPFPCTITNCSKKFVRKTDLQRHHQSVHTKERNHRCDFCGRMFARKDTLRRYASHRVIPLTLPSSDVHLNIDKRR